MVVVVVVIASLATTKAFIDYNNKPQGNESETIAGDGEGIGKALVVYQPSKGSEITKNIAYQLAKGINANGYEVTIAYPGEDLSNDISEYSIIVFGSPVYAHRTSVVLDDYIGRIKDFSGKKVVLFTTGMMDNSKQLEDIQELLNNANSPIEAQFNASQKDNKKRAYAIGNEVTKK
jgi:menaquinone-dependent protoporphyrinogen IX oxidase